MRHASMSAALATVLLGLVAATAHAQSAPPPSEAPAVAPAVDPDPPELAARFDAALRALGEGQLLAAAEGFERVAAESRNPVRQSTAATLGAQARERLAAQPSASGPSGALGSTSTPPGLAEPPAPPAPDDRRSERGRDGRSLLLGNVTLLSLAIYGPTLPVLVDPSSARSAIGLYMLGAGGTILGAYLGTRDAEVSWGTSVAWSHGATRGVLHGLGVLAVVGESTGSEKPLFAAMTLGSVLEGAVLAKWSDATHASAGRANAMGLVSDATGLIGMGLAVTASGSDVTGRQVAAAGVVGSAAGYVLGNAYADRRDLTWGDSEVLRASAVLGAYTAVVPLIVAESDNERVLAGSLIAGGVAGLVVGDRLLDGRDFSPGQGILVELTTVAGGLVGAGLGFMVAPNDGVGKIVATGAALGGVAGFALSYLNLDTKTPGASGTGVRVQITPDVRGDHRGLIVAGSF